MTTDINDLLAAASSVPAVADTSDRLPLLGWRNGVKQVKTGGFFYIKADDLGADVPDPDIWTEVNIYGEEIGYKADRLRLACLGYRQQAFFEEEVAGSKYPVKTWLAEWQQGAKIQTEALVAAEGLPGIWSWNSKGMTGRAVTGKGGIFAQHKRFTSAAAAAIKAQFSPWAFWMTIETKTDARGNPAYDDTGFKSFVTLPSLLTDPGEPTLDAARRLFVGTERYAELTAQYHQFKKSGWFEQRRGNAPAPAATFTPQADAAPSWDDGDDDDKLPF